MSIFRENLLALGAPYFNVVVRCVVEIDHRAKKTFSPRGLPFVTHKSRVGFPSAIYIVLIRRAQ